MHLLDSDYDEELLLRRPDETVCAIGEKQFHNYSRDIKHFHMTPKFILWGGGCKRYRWVAILVAGRPKGYPALRNVESAACKRDDEGRSGGKGKGERGTGRSA